MPATVIEAAAAAPPIRVSRRVHRGHLLFGQWSHQHLIEHHPQSDTSDAPNG